MNSFASQIARAHLRIRPEFVNTPQFLSEPLSKQSKARVVLKVETFNPVRSFKGRGANLFVDGLPDGVKELVCASAGNFGLALAYCARLRDIKVTVFAAKNANRSKIISIRRLGARVVLGGLDFDAAKERARSFADKNGVRFVEDGLETPISIGAGTAGLELTAWREPLDHIVVPLGNGALLEGIGMWFKTHSPKTQVIGVCSAGAPAMAKSLTQGALISTDKVSTIADGIAVRTPIARTVASLRELVDDVVLVKDSSLVSAMKLVFRHHGLVTEPAGVAGLAAILQHRQRFAGATVATLLCGSNLTDHQIHEWLV